MSGRYDFAARQGNSLDLTFRFRATDRVLVDLTGSALSLSVDTAPHGPRRFDLTVTTPASGEAALSLSPDETRTLPAGALPYEIERAVGGSQTTILSGVIVVSRGLNHD